MTGVGPSYQDRQWVQVQCSECREDMALGYLSVHLQTQHGKETVGIQHWGDTASGWELPSYNMNFLTTGGLSNCPVEGCQGRAATRTAMRVHFFHRHVQDTVIILEKGNLHHPWCPRYNILVPWKALNRRHLATA